MATPSRLQRRKLGAIAIVSGALIAGTIAVIILTSWAEVTGQTPAERIASIYRIAAGRPTGAGKALAKAAAEDPDPEVRKVAMASLMHFASPDLRATVEKGTADPAAEVRQVAAGTLSAYGDGQAAETLARLIEEDPDQQVQWAAVHGLAKCDDPRSIVNLLSLAEKDDRMDVKLRAAEALAGKLGAKLGKRHKPHDRRVWRDMIQRFKRMTVVQRAYAALSVPLIQRPQDLLGVNAHPERRDGTATDGAPK